MVLAQASQRWFIMYKFLLFYEILISELLDFRDTFSRKVSRMRS